MNGCPTKGAEIAAEGRCLGGDKNQFHSFAFLHRLTSASCGAARGALPFKLSWGDPSLSAFEKPLIMRCDLALSTKVGANNPRIMMPANGTNRFLFLIWLVPFIAPFSNLPGTLKVIAPLHKRGVGR